MEGTDNAKPVREWAKLGVTRAGGDFPAHALDQSAFILAPAGALRTRVPGAREFPGHQALQHVRPLRAVRRQPRRPHRRRRRLRGAWANVQQLSAKSIEAIQERLQALGYAVAKVDGKAGMNTRSLIGAYQKANGLKLDCWPTEALLDHVRAKAPEKGASRARAPTPARGETADVRRNRRQLGGRGSLRQPSAWRQSCARRPIVRAEPAASADAQAFFERLWPAAQARGISRPVFERAAAGFVPDPDVVELALLQPEHSKPVGTYVTDAREPAAHRHRPAARRDARGPARGHRGRLRRRSSHPPRHLGRSSSRYGAQMGSRSVIRSLATLAMTDARRSELWTRELIAALRMLQEGAVAPDRFVGSWAGAMRAHAVHPLDLRYARGGLRQGWPARRLGLGGGRAGIGRQLSARPRAGSPACAGARRSPCRPISTSPGRRRAACRDLAEWRAVGVRDGLGPRRSASGQPLRLVLPAGARGPAFLVSGNFRALLRYNQSTAYALSVGHLADRIAGGDGARDVLARGRQAAQRGPSAQELQALLATRGLDTGGLDGIIGDRTRDAIRATQRNLNLAEDGHPSAQRGALRDRAAPGHDGPCSGHVVDSLPWQGKCRIFLGLRLDVGGGRAWVERNGGAERPSVVAGRTSACAHGLQRWLRFCGAGARARAGAAVGRAGGALRHQLRHAVPRGRRLQAAGLWRHARRGHPQRAGRGSCRRQPRAGVAQASRARRPDAARVR